MIQTCHQKSNQERVVTPENPPLKWPTLMFMAKRQIPAHEIINIFFFLSWVFCFECGGVDWNDWAVNRRPTTIDDENVFQSDLYAAGVIEVSLKMWL